MSLFHESIKQILSDVDKFLTETLKKEKLSKKSNECKQQIIEKLQKFFEDNPSMRLLTQESVTAKETHDDSSLTGGSSKSDDSDEAKLLYIDPGVSVIAAADLTDPVCCGNLEKKQKKGAGMFGSTKFQTRWCVVHSGIFYYYVKSDDKKQRGAFRLEGYIFRNAPDMSSKKKEKDLCFEVYADDKAKRVYQFMAANKEDYDTWRDIINCGGILIEEDIYEPIGGPDGCGELPVYDDDVGVNIVENTGEVMEDFYEDPDNPISKAATNEPKPPTPPPPIQRRQDASDVPPTPPPSIKPRLGLPPLPPTSRSPSLKSRKGSESDRGKEQEMPSTNVPELIEEDIYDDGSSMDLPPPPPEMLNPSPPMPPRGKPPQDPLPPTPRQPPPVRNLPPLPPVPAEMVKTKVKIDIKCRPDEDFDNLYYGKWDCTSDGDSELSFKKGDIVHVVSRQFDDKSWWVGRLNGKFGLVPKNFLTPAYVVAR